MRLAGIAALAMAAPAAAASPTPWFRDVTASNLPPAQSVGRNGMDVQAADLDGDGDLDLVIPQEFLPNKILINQGRAVFRDASDLLPPLDPAELAPRGPPGHDSEDVSIADFDGDGVLDLVIVSEDDLPKLKRSPVHEYYRGLGKGRFARVLGQIPDTAADAVADADITGDGRPDLLIVGEGQDRLLINDGRGGFRDETAKRLPVEDVTGQDGQFVDVDGDGDLDIVIGFEGGHALWINNGGVFRDETAARLPPIANVEARKVAFGDIDGDGDIDLYFAHVGWAGRLPQDSLYLNDGRGYFRDVTLQRLPPEQDTTLDAKLVDIDRDGDLDLVTLADFARVYLNDGKGRFEEVTDRVLPHRIEGPHVALLVQDLNGDGWPDIYATMLSRMPGAAQIAHDWMMLNTLGDRRRRAPTAALRRP